MGKYPKKFRISLSLVKPAGRNQPLYLNSVGDLRAGGRSGHGLWKAVWLSTIAAMFLKLDPQLRMLGFHLTKPLPGFAVRAIIDDDDLEVVVILLERTGQGFLQKRQSIVAGDQNGCARPVWSVLILIHCLPGSSRIRKINIFSLKPLLL